MKKLKKSKLKKLAKTYFSSGPNARKEISDHLWTYSDYKLWYYRRAYNVPASEGKSLAFIAMYEALQELFGEGVVLEYPVTIKMLCRRAMTLYRGLCKDFAGELKSDRKKMHKHLSKNASFRVYDRNKREFSKIKLEDFTSQNVVSSIDLLIDLAKSPEDNYIVMETVGLIEDWFAEGNSEKWVREVFFRVYMDGEEVSEVARSINMPLSTLYRNLDSLKKDLKLFLDDKGCYLPDSENVEGVHRLFNNYQTPNENIDAQLFGTVVYETLSLRRGK
jgi:hypothetical protein